MIGQEVVPADNFEMNRRDQTHTRGNAIKNFSAKEASTYGNSKKKKLEEHKTRKMNFMLPTFDGRLASTQKFST